MAAISVSSLRLSLWTLLFASAMAHAQGQGNASPAACAARPSYPLPNDLAQVRVLADRLDRFAADPACLKDASFHAYRGAVLVSLGRASEAVEPLERALLIDPDLPGATLDLAEALAMQGDQASATALLALLRGRADLPEPVRIAIDRRTATLAALAANGAAAATPPETPTWQSRWQFATMAGHDSNLNNAPSTSEVTLTLPTGSITLPLDPSTGPRKGNALMATAQWQALKTQGESVLVLQGELRARHTSDSATGYEQADVSASWLQAPAAPRQWVGRVSASFLRFGGQVLFQAYRASAQHQWDAFSVPWVSRVLRTAGSCRPSAAVELEMHRYPSTTSLDGLYQGAAGGLICRADDDTAPAGTVSQPASIFNLQLRLGAERPFDSLRPGGTYRRTELRAQWEGPGIYHGKTGVQWSSTLQEDSQPYSEFLGNVPRRIYRNGLQIEGSWPISSGFSLIATAEIGKQRSNITVFESRQRSFYIGIRRDLM